MLSRLVITFLPRSKCLWISWLQSPSAVILEPPKIKSLTVSMEIKRCLFLGRKRMTNWESILKSRDITLPTKVLLVKAMVFPGVMYECESWTVKKSEVQTIDAFELWCWRRLLRVPWTARWLHQSNLKEISPDIHWKDWCWSSNTLATWCEELTHWKNPDAGKD